MKAFTLLLAIAITSTQGVRVVAEKKTKNPNALIEKLHFNYYENEKADNHFEHYPTK